MPLLGMAGDVSGCERLYREDRIRRGQHFFSAIFGTIDSMAIQDLKLASVEHLHAQVFLPISGIATEMARARQLASSTADALQVPNLSSGHRERFYSSLVTREILPHYCRLLEHYNEYRAELAPWVGHDAVALEHELRSSLSEPSGGLFADDPPIILAFLRDAEEVSKQLAVRLRELAY